MFQGENLIIIKFNLTHKFGNNAMQCKRIFLSFFFLSLLPSICDSIFHLRLDEVVRRRRDGIFVSWRIINVDANRMKGWQVGVILIQ